MRGLKKYIIVILALLAVCFAAGFAACGNKETPPADTRRLWGTLSGTVTDYSASPVDPSPVAGVTVKSGKETAVTDENGSYEIKVYNDGATVTFEKEGRITQSKTFKTSSFRGEKAEYSFIMYASVKIQGSVKDKSGNPVQGAAVSVGIQQTVTDAQGSFSFEEVIATTMVVKAIHNGKIAIKAVYAEDTLSGTVTIEIIME